MLKFACSHQIKPDDPAWMLVEMLGHVRYTTDTLPARIEAAGNNAVEAINQQRLIEQRAFSANAMRETALMMDAISQKIAEKSDSITQEQLHRRLLINSFFTINGLTLIIAGSVSAGLMYAEGNVNWVKETDNNFINVMAHILNLPIGYVVIPWLVISAILLVRGYWLLNKDGRVNL
ncbi:hypothetical protein [Methylophaga sp.]|uniref:hypothetical protein n=1 Tax=Methylophaga sp. TaxID=2024840 RepID=UPI00272D4AAD|nr:hypothetical protein [Methylophaga sp.]